MNQKSIIEIAIAAKLELDIIYAGGSHPGTVRRILPVSIRNGVLKATSSGEMKSFKLDLITLVGQPEEDSFRNYSGIQDILLLEQKRIMDAGILLEADRFHLVLEATGGPVLSLSSKQGTWSVNSHRCTTFQEAAELFITAMMLASIQLKDL